MEVAYWQLFVIASVLIGCVLKGPRVAFWISAVWTAWTLAVLVYLPLVAIQLLSAWGTYLACRRFVEWRSQAKEQRALREASEQRTSELQRELNELLADNDLPEPGRTRIESLIAGELSGLSFVQGRDHYSLLLSSIQESKHTLCILSGWIGAPLLEHPVQDALRSALARGVNVYIGYGWESMSGSHELSDIAKRAKKSLESLQEHARRRLPGHLYLSQFPNHEKELVVDDEYVVIGSHNWLSNKTFRNTERSVVIFSHTSAGSECRRITALVKQGQEAVA